MQIQKRLKTYTSEQGETAVKVLSFHLLPVVIVSAHILVVLLSVKKDLFPGPDAWMAILTTCSQIIAGLYGITLAGYTFFLSRIDALTASDATLDYVVVNIKTRFKYLIWYITFCVLAALIISISLMYFPAPESEKIGFLYRLICNEFVLFAVFSILLILYYSILVVDPNCIVKEAAKLKRKLGGRFSAPGNAVEFITLYDRIEKRCIEMLPTEALQQLHSNKGPHFELTLELLKAQYPMLHPMFPDLNRLHRYYECTVNCTPIAVSQEMCSLAARILGFLSQASSVVPPKNE